MGGFFASCYGGVTSYSAAHLWWATPLSLRVPYPSQKNLNI